MNLPAQFITRMQQMLGEEYDKFATSYERPVYRGLRLNTLRYNSVPEICDGKVPWCDTGYYYSDGAPGKSALHEAGAYYIQEPSAMSVITAADIKDGELVLDLCAAPGGKSTQIACANLSGLLIANEIIPSRAKILAQNIERMGIANAIVTCEDTATLADRWDGIFDTVIADAPCSGEGMFAKAEIAITEWSLDNVTTCAERQIHILDNAAKAVKDGGKLIYSTCTFSKEENEDNVRRFLAEHKEFTQIPTPLDGVAGIRRGYNNLGYRLYPHLIKGEGHFVAAFRKSGENNTAYYRREKLLVPPADIKAYTQWADKYLANAPICNNRIGDMLYYTPPQTPRTDGIKRLRTGLPLGSVKGGRFEPDHSLAKYLKVSDAKQVFDLSENSEEIKAYLHGESLPCDKSGWTLVAVDGVSLGWGKSVDGILKNKYPKGLRI